MLLGLLGALVAALAYGTATILQALGVAAMARSPKEASLAQKAKNGWLYAVGTALDGVGFLASAGALRSLPLFLVQSVIASSVAVTAVLAVFVLGVRLSRREIAALGVVAVGLAILASIAEEGPAHSVPSWLGVVTLASLAVVATVAFVGYRTGNGNVLALAAGLSFSGVGVAARILPWHGSVLDVLGTVELWALILHGSAAVVLYGFALERGRTTSVAAITFATETVVPSLVGIVLLGDTVRHGTWPLGVLGFALTLGGCFVLAGQSEPSKATA